jgi:hypothetical protein
MIDWNKHQIAAMDTASQAAGEYVESIGKTDLATFTEPEWASLIRTVVIAFQDHLGAAYAVDPPF